jgi:predicted lysophospholipase L1 biosynthesis ABC-type transport system permease subunit
MRPPTVVASGRGGSSGSHCPADASVAASLIQDVPASGALPFVVAAAVMLAIAFLAAYIPASGAARVDPMEALRRE